MNADELSAERLDLGRTVRRTLSRLVLLLIVLVQSLLFGQSTEGSACGFVTDRFGEPLAVASVEAAGTERRATADGKGKYCVTGLSAGEGEHC